MACGLQDQANRTPAASAFRRPIARSSGRGSYAFDRAAHATILADGSKRTSIETEQGARVDPG
jgi:hypothetical protein